MKKLIALASVAIVLAGCGHRYAPIGYDPGPIPKPYELVLCAGSPPYSPEPDNPLTPIPGAPVYRMVYHAWFPDGKLACGFMDRIHSSPQALKPGDGQVAGTTGIFVGPAASGALLMQFTAPDPIPPDSTPSVGVFSTGLSLGPRAVFSVRATFRAPDGPHLPPSLTTNAWAVAVVARTGDERDLTSEARLAVTFRVKNNAATLNVLEPSGSRGSVPIPPDIYDRIFGTGGKPPEPFTLELFVDRRSGKGVASLIPSWPSVRVPFDLMTFGPQTGPQITAVGAALADCCAPGATVRVEVSDFRISQLFGRGYLAIEPNVPQPPPIKPL